MKDNKRPIDEKDVLEYIRYSDRSQLHHIIEASWNKLKRGFDEEE